MYCSLIIKNLLSKGSLSFAVCFLKRGTMLGGALGWAVLLVMCGCAAKPKNEAVPKNMKYFFSEKLNDAPQPKQIDVDQSKIIRDEPHVVITFPEVLVKEGIPSYNITPRNKEQIAIYDNDQKISVYYFKENILYMKREYSVKEMNELISSENYPENLYK